MEKIYILERQQIASQWGLQLIFRMHNSGPTPQRMERMEEIEVESLIRAQKGNFI
jgi:hypothetical protein